MSNLFWRGKRVLVTGALGLIGRPVCRMLEAAHAEVYRYDIAPDDAGHEGGGDILDMDALLRTFEEYPPPWSSIWRLCPTWGSADRCPGGPSRLLPWAR